MHWYLYCASTYMYEALSRIGIASISSLAFCLRARRFMVATSVA